MSIVGNLSALNSILSGELIASDDFNPLESDVYKDDYLLTDVTVGEYITISLESDAFDTYLQLVDADTGELIADNDDYGDGLNSQLSFVAVAGINYIVRVSHWDKSQLGAYQLNTSTLSAPDLPDLTVKNIIAPDTATVYDTLSISWTEENIGVSPANGYWYGEIYYSDDPYFDYDDDEYLEYWERDDYDIPVVGGKNYTSSITIPNIEPGEGYLLFVVDFDKELEESNESNNIIAVPIEISGIDANLTVTGSAQESANLGENIAVSWTVSNTGSVDASNYWYDYIYISNDEYYDSNDTYVTRQRRNNDTPLAPGANYTVDRNVTIPNYAEGGWSYLLFVTDRNNTQAENDETDNVYAVPLELNVPDVDLEITNTDAPNTALVKEKLSR